MLHPPLLQLALSRTREFNADLGAAAITGDPAALASALAKLEYEEGSFLRRLFLPSAPQAEWLRTHPASSERIRRLHALIKQPGHNPWLQKTAHMNAQGSRSRFGRSHIYFI
jgi:heat shock protein HtpX